MYIPSLNKVISTKDILIKEDLDYKDDYITKDNYSNLLEELELREDLEKDLTSLELPSNLDSNKESFSTKDISTKDKSTKDKSTNISPNNIRDNTELEGVDSNIANNDNNSDLDELNSEYYNNSSILNRASRRIRSVEPENQGLSIYKLASQAYYTTLEETDKEDIKETKIIAPNNSNIIEPLDYKEASNSLYKEYWAKSEDKELVFLKNNNT